MSEYYPRDMEITIRCGLWPFRRIKAFKGWCTVWHDVATGKRPNALTEKRLSEIWWKFTH